MPTDLQGIRVAVLGGDAREVYLVKFLSELGICLNVVGLPVKGYNITLYNNPEEGLDGVQAVILPTAGINEQGYIYSPYLEQPLFLPEDLLATLPAGMPLFVGVARPPLKEMARRLGLQIIEVLKLDEAAILNSIPSAEGAIQIAMEKLPITIHGSRSFVTGFGRTGVTLARMLVALNAETTVVARSPAQRARAFEMGCRVINFPELPDFIGEAEVIFNTVPALVLTEEVLLRASTDVLVIDLASSPGGTDFKAARRLGVTAILAPGLPGKVAPKTAGEILARVIPRLLAEKLDLVP